jgi:Zn-dependent protease with chaperone function
MTTASPESLYPPAPANVPADLVRPALRYRLMVVLVLLGLFLFLLVYIALMAGWLVVLLWALFPPADVLEQLGQSTEASVLFVVLRCGLCAASAMFFAFLFKGFLARQVQDPLDYVEITEDRQPELFRFIRRLCGDVGCPMPARAYVNADVNAAVFHPTSVWGLVAPPPKNLLIGLGLVNMIDLAEFKALLAHEFGHFSQRSLRLESYMRLVHLTIYNMLYVRDSWDNWMIQGFDTPVVSAFAVPLYMLVEGTRKGLGSLFTGLDLAYRSLSRQLEFNADLASVRATGSDAVVNLLEKIDPAVAAMMQADRELALAAEHQCYSRDLFFHQQRAAEALRTTESQSATSAGADPGRVVNRATIWADHPSHADRQENAKRRYFPSPRDDRPAWVLFQDAGALRQETTRCYYELWFHVDPAEVALEPDRVQAFLDEERAVLAIDARYRGVYDNRYLELRDMEELVSQTLNTITPPAEQLASFVAGLYSDELVARLGDRRRRLDEAQMLSELSAQGKGAGQFTFRGELHAGAEAGVLLTRVDGELEEDRQYLERFDRRVFTLHQRLAVDLGEGAKHRQRYEFQLALEQVLQIAWGAFSRVEDVLRFLSSRSSIRVDEISGLVAPLGESGEGIAELYRQSAHLVLLPLSHLPAGEKLSSVLPPMLDTSALGSSESLHSGLLQRTHGQLMTIIDRLQRIRIKSLSAILALQEELVSKWALARASESRA